MSLRAVLRVYPKPVPICAPEPVRTLRSAQLPDVERDTAICPWLVAHGVITELERTLNTVFDEDAAETWAQALCERCHRVYAHNPRYRQRLRSAQGRGWCQSFMRHWFSAILFRTRHPIYKSIPSAYKWS